MLRWLKWLFILWLLAVFILPLVSGFVIQSQLPPGIIQIDQRMDGVRFGEPVVNRGWFSSVISMDINPDSGDDSLEMTAELDHGPLSYLRASWLTGQISFAEKGRQPGSDPVAVVDLDIGVTLTVGAEFDFEGDSIAGGIVAQSGRMARDWRVQLDDLDLSQPGAFRLENLSGELSLQAEQSPRFAIDILSDSLIMEGSGYDLTRPALRLGFDRAQELGELSLDWQADSMGSGESSVRDVRYRSVTSRMHIPSLLEMLSASRRALEAGYAGDALIQQLVTNLFFVLPGLVDALPQHDLQQLSYSSPLGPVDVSGQVMLTATPKGAYLSDLSVLLEVLDASLNAELPQRQMRQMLVDWVNQQNPGLSLQEEATAVDLIIDRYALAATDDRSDVELLYRDSTLLINGVENQ